MAAASGIDPFTAEISRESLVSVAEEMFVSLQRTSQSTIIYEVLDFACGITDDRAQLIAQTNGVTAFAGILTYTVQSVLDKYGRDDIRPGDIFCTNDPYTGGGTHLSDVGAAVLARRPGWERGAGRRRASRRGCPRHASGDHALLLAPALADACDIRVGGR